VGRVAVIIDYRYCETVGEKVGFFGFFECIQDYNIFSALLDVSQRWLASKGLSVMRGPINGRVDVGCGFLYTGFDSPPSLLSSYSPPYYISFAEKFGIKRTKLDINKKIKEGRCLCIYWYW